MKWWRHLTNESKALMSATNGQTNRRTSPSLPAIGGGGLNNLLHILKYEVFWLFNRFHHASTCEDIGTSIPSVSVPRTKSCQYPGPGYVSPWAEMGWVEGGCESNRVVDHAPHANLHYVLSGIVSQRLNTSSTFCSAYRWKFNLRRQRASFVVHWPSATETRRCVGRYTPYNVIIAGTHSVEWSANQVSYISASLMRSGAVARSNRVKSRQMRLR